MVENIEFTHATPGIIELARSAEIGACIGDSPWRPSLNGRYGIDCPALKDLSRRLLPGQRLWPVQGLSLTDAVNQIDVVVGSHAVSAIAIVYLNSVYIVAAQTVKLKLINLKKSLLWLVARQKGRSCVTA